MPSPIVKSLAKKNGLSVADVEKLWDRAKAAATNQIKKDDPNFYAYVVAILKKMVKGKAAESLLDTVLESKNVREVMTVSTLGISNLGQVKKCKCNTCGVEFRCNDKQPACPACGSSKVAVTEG